MYNAPGPSQEWEERLKFYHTSHPPLRQVSKRSRLKQGSFSLTRGFRSTRSMLALFHVLESFGKAEAPWQRGSQGVAVPERTGKHKCTCGLIHGESEPSPSTDSIVPPGGATAFNQEPFVCHTSNQNSGIIPSDCSGDQGISHCSELNCNLLEMEARGGSHGMKWVLMAFLRDWKKRCELCP